MKESFLGKKGLVFFPILCQHKWVCWSVSRGSACFCWVGPGSQHPQTSKRRASAHIRADERPWVQRIADFIQWRSGEKSQLASQSCSTKATVMFVGRSYSIVRKEKRGKVETWSGSRQRGWTGSEVDSHRKHNILPTILEYHVHTAASVFDWSMIPFCLHIEKNQSIDVVLG